YQVAEEPVRPICLPTISAKSLEKKRNAHLVVAAPIATFAFAAAITVPSGLQSDKRSKQGTPLFIHEAAFKAFIVTNALAFLYSVSALTIHFGLWIIYYQDIIFGIEQFQIELNLFLGSLGMQRLQW
ncbi:hypothetical protein Gogos_002518, partial [Gossypium gossypioides]|nr:hypothetical protein [Gossypium gossypioides]